MTKTTKPKKTASPQSRKGRDRKGGKAKGSTKAGGRAAITTPEGLTEQQEKFCIEFFRLGVATEAYKIAYPASLEWKSRSLEVEASRMLANPDIALRIASLRRQAADRAVVSEAKVLQEAARIGFADIRELFDEHGKIKPMSEWTDSFAAAVSSIEVLHASNGEVVCTTKVRLNNKNNALEKLFRHLGMYEKDNRQKAPILANLDKLPPEVQDLIAEKLYALAGRDRPVIPGQSGQGTGRRTTH